MPKIAAFLVVPGALGGAALLHDPVEGPLASQRAQLIEVGVTFDEEAVRNLLPTGFTPSGTFTGGLALYMSPDGLDGDPATQGYVWIDINYRGNARYVVQSFPPAAQRSESTSAMQAAYRSSEAEVIEAGVGTEVGGGLAVAIKPLPATCRAGLAQASPYVFLEDPSGTARLTHSPVFSRWCDAELVALDLQAATDDSLSWLEPRQVNWVGLATPLE